MVSKFTVLNNKKINKILIQYYRTNDTNNFKNDNDTFLFIYLFIYLFSTISKHKANIKTTLIKTLKTCSL